MKTHLLRLLLALLVLLPGSGVASGNCGSFVSDMEINECASRELDRAEAALNATYSQVLADLGSADSDALEQKQARTQLVRAQRLWVAFRSADCDAVFTLNQDGSVRIPAYLFCMSAHAEQRSRQLANLLR